MIRTLNWDISLFQIRFTPLFNVTLIFYQSKIISLNQHQIHHYFNLFHRCFLLRIQQTRSNFR